MIGRTLSYDEIVSRRDQERDLGGARAREIHVTIGSSLWALDTLLLDIH